MEPTDRVLLIDVENSVGAVSPKPDLVRVRVHALRRAAGQVHHVLACYSQDNPDRDQVVSVLAEMGIASWLVRPGPDAAELALLAHARYVHARGGREFVVASGDHAFVALAELGTVDVVMWKGQVVSHKLERVARMIRWVTRPPRPEPTPADDLSASPAPGTAPPAGHDPPT